MAGWLEQRLHLSRLHRGVLRKAFPVHHSFFLGEIALFSLVILVVTGVFLSLNYEASSRLVSVGGHKVPAAYGSILFIDTLPLGALLRSAHHWAAHLMIIAIVLHLLRVLLTGAYQRPREVNWIIGLCLLGLTVMAAFTGYALADDAFAVTATRIGYGIASAIPWIGGWIAEVIFGGTYPTAHSLPRLLAIHITWIPVLLGSLVVVHLLVMYLQKHTQPGYARRVAPGRILGVPLWPQQAAMMAALFLMCLGVVLLVAGAFGAHPVQAFGPPGVSTPAVKPDWYFLWVYGLLELIPSTWQFDLLGAHLTPEFFGGILIPGIIGLGALLLPLVRPRATPLRYAESPLHHPRRTGGVLAVVAFFAIASLAGYHHELGWPRGLLWALLVGVPIVVFAGTSGLLRWRGRGRPAGDEPGG